jgi:hypothetical protein
LDLSAKELASLSNEQKSTAPARVSKKSTATKSKPRTKASNTNNINNNNNKKAAPPNYIKILCKQKQKGITYEVILEVSYYIRTSDR